ncbi:MAG: heme ABC exporter ATP-binding protein CcmA [Rhodospirillaceae bacterium TMED8]|nr:heme ABC transporter ATP-binding protein CcmA [Magnetovibrio sp.]OUT52163.1 MAG: heme ABC exporter ATP-binding protein CcmA [Rhodospirillaceae bacterium TMED8]|tara:strand:- start:500 stop:1171 length:672 start_codon:yes stop_codon:yes gene_type:complete
MVTSSSDRENVYFASDQVACFRGGRTVFVGVTFSINSGGAVLVKGPNGIGKSTMLRILAGLMRPIYGTLKWHDHKTHVEPEIHFKRIHYVGHHDPVKPALTVIENVSFWASLHGTRDHVQSALEEFDIAHLADVPARFLSAGQKRKVNLTRILTAPTRLWLLDEPTTGLDAATVAKFEQCMAAHRNSGGMIILSTHTPLDLPEAQVLNLSDYQPEAAAHDNLY